MFRRGSIRAYHLLGCPVCSSRAVSAIEAEHLDDGRQRCCVRCGACQTWRSFVLTPRLVRVLRRRFKRDLRQLARTLQRAPLADVEGELHALSVARARMTHAGRAP